MIEVLSESIRLVNLPFTVLLGLVVLYWLFVILGALDLDFGADAQAELSGDGDLSGDAHTDSDLHGHQEGTQGGGWVSDLLHFVNIGDVPLMIVASILTLCAWLFSMIVNHYWTGGSVLLALAALLPNLVVSLVVTRYLTLPLRPLFRLITKDSDDDQAIVGQSLITTSEANSEFGQAQIATTGAPLLINVRTLDGSALPRGASAVVVRAEPSKGVYLVAELPRPQLQS
ncbi:MAG: YqiJ family protein [Verrucomicrobiota bacterium]|nr:YqiJ family protein [Verrucomicrobiota bacterium]